MSCLIIEANHLCFSKMSQYESPRVNFSFSSFEQELESMTNRCWQVKSFFGKLFRFTAFAKNSGQPNFDTHNIQEIGDIIPFITMIIPECKNLSIYLASDFLVLCLLPRH